MAQKVRGECRGAFLSGRTLLMWAKFWQADKIRHLSAGLLVERGPCARQTGGLREPRTRSAPRWTPEISLLPLRLQSACCIIRLSSRAFSRAPIDHVGRGRPCVAMSTCALTAFSDDTSPATAPNKPQGSDYAVLKIRNQTLDSLTFFFS